LAILLALGAAAPAAGAEATAAETAEGAEAGTGATPPAAIRDIFPDPAFAERLLFSIPRQFSAWTLDTVVTQDDLNAVTWIIDDVWPDSNVLSERSPSGAPAARIVSLQGIQYLTNLEQLRLPIGQVSDLTPLAGLTSLGGLGLPYNQISDLTPLAGLTNLRELWAHEQHITLDPIVFPPGTHTQLTIESLIVNRAGLRIAPDGISDSGTYSAPYIIWAELPTDTPEVWYTFHDPSSSLFMRFSGTVIQPLLPPLLFNDVPHTAWFHDAVEFVHDRNLMTGTSPITFSPNTELTRAMTATILHRMAGEPAVTDRQVFDDVAANRWYSDAAIWAYDAGIVRGTGPGTFAPGANITREQFATMLHRYAQYTGQNITLPPAFNLAQFTDHGDVSDWAYDAMRWAVYTGLINGTTSTTLAPQDTTTRAQTATMLMRFIQK